MGVRGRSHPRAEKFQKIYRIRSCKTKKLITFYKFHQLLPGFEQNKIIIEHSIQPRGSGGRSPRC